MLETEDRDGVTVLRLRHGKANALSAGVELKRSPGTHAAIAGYLAALTR